MRRILIYQMGCIAALVIFSFQCYAQTISSTELINNAKRYDTKVVTYQGEVVGDIMIRGEHAWLSVNDNVNALGAWTTKASLKEIKYIGNYWKKGDVIEVTGIFHRSCPEHGGDLDIHAQRIVKIRAGSLSSQPINKTKVSVAISLSIVVMLAYFSLRIHKRA